MRRGTILDELGKRILIFDGGMGTLLQEKGLGPGELPEVWNLERATDVISIHRSYIEAGSDIILTNTFGANALKFHDERHALEDVVKAAVHNVREAFLQAGKTGYVALDVGPTGKLLKPMGDLGFEEAYAAFREVMVYGEKAGVDLIHIETMSDTYEMKAAVLAAKENTDLPVFVTAVFDERKKLLTGADVLSVVSMLEGLRVDALGVNCGLGPIQMEPVLDELFAYSSLPVIVKPNAGLPKSKDGKTVYDISPAEFVDEMEKIVQKGALVVGGCCGTNPEHISLLARRVAGMEARMPQKKTQTVVSSYGKAVMFGERSQVIGERINPTGKKKLKAALKEHDIDYILKEAIMQEERGAHILDVNVGLPDIDEEKMMREVVEGVQSITSLPLQIDTVDKDAMESALRVYNGKAMVNSVSGKQESMDAVFPLIQKYGGVVVALLLDEDGIPDTVDERIAIARRIIAEAAKYGIEKKDLVMDALAMTISSEPRGAVVTLETLRRLRDEVGVHTVLGVSNISFGLPMRPVINAAFYTMALYSGLSAGIINPASDDMMRAYDSYHALMNLDDNCGNYISKYGGMTMKTTMLPIGMAGSTAADGINGNMVASDTGSANAGTVRAGFDAEGHGHGRMTLRRLIEKGMKDEAGLAARELLAENEPLAIINEHLIPALDFVGKGFEAGTVFLPQLLMSAEAAKSAFQVLRESMENDAKSGEKKEKIVLATVKGDIHDIGKNIVKVLLENYNFEVVDLGKDVPPEKVVEAVKAQNVRLVGLSALMTTTVVSMEETIRLLRKEAPDCKVMVGGAVLNQDYADMIGADFYGKDAMQSVYYAQRLLQGTGTCAMPRDVRPIK